MRRSAPGLLVFGTMIQIGSCIFATIVGAYFAAGSSMDPEFASAAQPLAFVATSLPVFLVLSVLLLTFIVRFRTEHQDRASFQDVKSVSPRLGGIGDHVKVRMRVQNKVEFVVGPHSELVYLTKKRGSNRIIVGDGFLNVASDEELEGILAHEIAHVSRKANRQIVPILATGLLVFQILFIPMPRIFIVLGTVFAILLLLTIPTSWKTEYDTDRVAAECVGVEKVILGLKRLTKKSLSGMSLTHPPLASRIKKLERFSRSLSR